MTPEKKRELANSYDKWWHKIDFGDGIISNGLKPISVENELACWGLSEDYFRDKSLLDVGASDGGFSFYAEKSGALKVVAFDQEAEDRDKIIPDRTKGFKIAKKILDSKVDLVTGDLDQPNALDNLGKFDIVLFAGVFYHLENPFIALRNIKSTLKNGSKLFVETNFSHLNTGDAPHLEFYPKNSLNGDYTNFFSPNPSCLKFMLEEIGDFHLINNETKIAGRRFWQQYVYKK